MHRSKWQSRSGIWEKSNSERRGKREERREKRDGSVPEGRDGREKGRALGETREERKEKREDPCRNNEQLNCNRVCTFPGRAAAKEATREKREERRKMVRSQKGGMVEKKVGPRERRGKSGKRSEKGRPLGGKREESRQKNRREKREEITKKAARDPQID